MCAHQETRSRRAPEAAFIGLIGTGLPSCSNQSRARDENGLPIPGVSTSEVHDVSTARRVEANRPLARSRWGRVAFESQEVTLCEIRAANIFALRHVMTEVSRTGHPQSRGSTILAPMEQFLESFNWHGVSSRGDHPVHAGFRRRRPDSDTTAHETDSDTDSYRGDDDDRALYDSSRSPEVWLNAERRGTCFSGCSLPHAYWFPQ